MTEKQYIKYLLNVNGIVIKMWWCPKCKQKSKCDQKMKEYCVVRYEEKQHKNKWTLEEALAKENEKEKALKEKIKEVKKKLKGKETK